MAIGWGADDPERDALGVHSHRAFEASLPPVHRVFARPLAAARSLGDAAVYGHLERIETNSSIIGFPSELFERIHRSLLDPLVAPTTQRGGRTSLIGYSPVGAAEDKNLEELLEDYPIGHTRPVAAKRMVHFSFRQQGSKLLPDGLNDVWWHCGHGDAPLPREASATPRMIEQSMSVYIQARSLLAQALKAS
jgi:hypothetical protein